MRQVAKESLGIADLDDYQLGQCIVLLPRDSIDADNGTVKEFNLTVKLDFKRKESADD